MLNPTLDPWVGARYQETDPRILTIAESRYDSDYTDRHIGEDFSQDSIKAATFTKYLQAITGLRHWEPGYKAAKAAFWNSSIFHNFNQIWFPGGPRVAMPWEARTDPRNAEMLREVLERYQPTHAIVWGFNNWSGLEIAGEEWSDEFPIPGTTEPFCMVSGFDTLFTRLIHPSCGFSYETWAPMLKNFLAMKPGASEMAAVA